MLSTPHSPPSLRVHESSHGFLQNTIILYPLPCLPKAPTQLDANGPGAHEPELSLPLSHTRQAKNLDFGYLNSVRWSVFPSCLWDRKKSVYPKEDRKDHRGGMQVIQVLVIFSVSPKSMALYSTLRRGHMCPSPESQGLLVVMLKWKWLMGGGGAEDRLALAPRCLQHT